MRQQALLQLSARRHPPRPRSRRGFSLLDALIAMAIMAFGLLAMTRFQGRLVAQATESGSRLVALQAAEELMSTVLVDVGNATCYTLPQVGACASSAATTLATGWATRTGAALPGTVTALSALSAGGQFTVTITWTGKDSNDTRTLEATTDVRP
jgi:Tfp pilus assembly protein PilV